MTLSQDLTRVISSEKSLDIVKAGGKTGIVVNTTDHKRENFLFDPKTTINQNEHR